MRVPQGIMRIVSSVEKQSKLKDGTALDFSGHLVSSSGSKEGKEGSASASASASAQCPFAQLGAPNPHTKLHRIRQILLF